MSKTAFLRRVVRHRLQGQPRRCPYCGSPRLRKLGHKWLIVDVVRCTQCDLMFRYPLDTPADNMAYYEHEYRSGIVTDLPAISTLRAYLRDNFAGTAYDSAPKIRVLQTATPGGKVLDYGCSWGYNTYQLRAHGYDALGFEISAGRAHYGRLNLGVPVLSSLDELERLADGTFDAIFTNHVLEHLPSIPDTFALFARLLKPSGVAVHVLPNFTGAKARAGLFWKWIGEAHPLAPDVAFFNRTLPDHGFEVVCGSSPFDSVLLERLERGETEMSCEGDELVVLARKRPT